ncbi:hypothetical protein BTW10_11490 [Chromohalobacter japonicus]|uniref:Transposase DDE domain-containing protein n=1 Tax=Chromohalobacter japonicus TaxID=223900 RepID=A0A1Q8TBT4_9GAMM|nr:hypothetical protein BTW10_11490 [Chromohalobacter japonicus]
MLQRALTSPGIGSETSSSAASVWIKKLSRVCTRYDKLASCFRAMVCLACIDRCLRADFPGRTYSHESNISQKIWGSLLRGRIEEYFFFNSHGYKNLRY